MTQAAFAAEIIRTFAKPFLSGVLSLATAISPVLPQKQGGFLELASDSLSSDSGKVRIEAYYSIETPSYEYINDVGFEITADTYEGKLDIYADLNNPIFNVYLDEEKENAIYLDTEGYTISPTLGKVFATEAFTEDFGYYYDYDEFAEVHTENYEDRHYGESWEEYFENKLYGVEFTSRISSEAVAANVGLSSDFFELLTLPENTAQVGIIGKETFDFAEKYFYTETVDGENGYGVYLDGMDIVNYLYDVTAVIDSEEYRNAQDNFKGEILGKLNVEDYVKTVYGEDADTKETYEIKKSLYDMMSVILPSMTKSEISTMSEHISAIREFAGNDMPMFESFEEMYDYVIEQGYGDPLEYLEKYSIYYPLYKLLAGSHIDLFLYPKDDTVCLNAELLIDTGDDFGSLKAKLNCIISEYDGELIPSENYADRYSLQDCISKLINNKASEKGVYKTEISWYSEFDDRYDEPAISDEEISVWYLEDDMKAIFTSPAFSSMSAENRNNIISLFEDKYCYDYVYNTIDVELIDNSTYLPLRQIAESCGLTVEWDSEARKAYVIKDDINVDMTGTIIGNRTYVKVRDFEKLGAVIEYDEYMPENYTDDNYRKHCCVTISFFKP